MEKKIISAGHICIDITPVFTTDKTFSKVSQILEPGKLIQMGPASVHTGGSVSNTGLALKLMGANVQLMGKIGKDSFGTMVQGILAEHGASGLIVDENSSTSYTVLVVIPGIDRILLHNPGANDTFFSEDIPEAALQDAALFHLGYPTLMKKLYQNDGEALEALYRRIHDMGIATSMDMAAVDPASEAGQADWEKILSRALPHVDFFVPSFEELLFMLNRARYDELAAQGGDMTDHLDMLRDVKPLADKCLALGCRAVLIKCGISGMYYKTSDRMDQVGSRVELNAEAWTEKEGIQPCFRIDKVLSGAGAGDTSIAAFLLAMTQGLAPERCVSLAAAQGACAVTCYDNLSGVKTLEELAQMIDAGWETV